MKNIILVLEGGCMLGVYGAGVLTAFQDANLYPHIKSVYAGSAGAHNGAYFLARETRKGSSIYYEDLINDTFIKKHLFWQHLKEVLFYKKGTTNYIDIDHLIEVERRSKTLNTHRIRAQTIPFKAKAFNLTKQQSVYLDVRENPLEFIRASSAIAPFYHNPFTHKGEQYIDGEIICTKKFTEVIGTHPDDTIVFIRNVTEINKNISYFLTALFEALLITREHGLKTGKLLFKTKFNPTTNQELLTHKNVILIENPLPYSRTTTNKKELLQLYRQGIKDGKKTLQSLP